MTEQLYSLSFKLLGLPTGERNARRHWRTVRAEIQRSKSAVDFACLGRKPVAPLPYVRAIFTRHSATRPDPTNLAESFKAVEDGLVASGILVDDNAANYVGGTPTYAWEHAPPGRGFITVRIEEVKRDGSKKEEDDGEEGPGGDTGGSHDGGQRELR